MDLDFTAEQEMLREMVRGVCASSAPLGVVRALEDDPVGYPAELWKQLVELDLVGLMLPTEYGGSGMSALEGAILYEELGRSRAPSPHYASAVLSAGAVLAAGTDAQRQGWVPAIAAGDAIVVPAWLEPGNGFGPRGVQARAERDGEGFTISGTKWHIPFASSANRLLVLARTGPADTDVDLFLVDPEARGVTITQQMTVASSTQHEAVLAGVHVDGADRLGAGAGTGWAAWHATMLDAAILLAAQAVGGAQYALEITVQYAKDREQFDKPLGAFQAIAHYLADASTAVDGATILVHEAAWARSEGRPVDRLAPMAKLFACQTFRDVTAMAQQVFGGVGFTLEYDIQLYFRRAKALQITWWDDAYLEELVAASVLD
jgi:alkylation response protein AidB-like acyl-CoA dehydrogenase